MTLYVPTLIIGFVLGVSASGIALLVASVIIGRKKRKAE